MVYVIIVMGVAMGQEITAFHRSPLVGFLGKMITFGAIMGLPVLWRHLKNKRAGPSKLIPTRDAKIEPALPTRTVRTP